MIKPPVVLIVEDDIWLAEQYIRTFQAAGMHTEHALHTLAAMDALEAHLPDVILLDVLLAGPNAFTLLHELRSHGDFASVPVVLCTNIAERLVAEELESYGVRYLLDKTTMKPEDVVAAVKRVLL